MNLGYHRAKARLTLEQHIHAIDMGLLVLSRPWIMAFHRHVMLFAKIKRVMIRVHARL
jgi:hypothetical protein